MQDVALRFTGSATGAVGAARETAAAVGTVRTETNRLSPSLRNVERDTGKMSRGVLAGSGALSGLGRSVAYASGAFLGAEGLIAGIKGAVEQAETERKAIDSLGVVIRRNNGDVGQAIPLIQKWAAGQREFGVSISQAEQGLARAAAITGSVQRAQVAYEEALVISKATGKDFNAVLIAASKAQDGQTSSLARYIGTVPKGISTQQLYNDVMAKYRGQAESNTSATDRLRASLANVELKVGQALLPIVEEYSGELDKWLSKSKNQKRITDDVTGAVHGLGVVLNDVIGAGKLTYHGLEKVKNLFGDWKPVIVGVTAALVAMDAVNPGLALAAGAVYVLTHWKKVEGWFERFGREMEKLGIELGNALANPFIRAANKIVDAYNKLFGWLTGNIGKLNTDPLGHVYPGAPKAPPGYDPNTYGMGASTKANPGGYLTKKQARKQGVTGGSADIQQGLVATGKTAIGNPYRFGGNPSLSSPTDCSGLMVAIFARHAIHLPRTSQEQYAQAPIKNAAPLAVGDLVFSEGVHPGHVGLYIGGGKVLEDPHTGDHVKVVSIDYFGWNGESARWWGGKSSGGQGHAGRSASGRGAGGAGSPFGNSPPIPSTSTAGSKTFKIPVELQNKIRKAQAAFSRDETKANLDALLKLYEEEDRLAKAHGEAEPAIGEIAAAKKSYRDHLKAIAAAAARQAAKVAAATITKIENESLGPANTLNLAQAAGASTAVILTDQKALLAAYETEAAQLKAKLAKSRGQAKAEYRAALTQINQLITSTQDGIVGSLQSLYQEAQQTVSDVLGQIQTAADTALGAKYFQGGLQTPAEQALAAMQAEDTANSLQDALTQAQAAGDPAQIAAAQRAIEENNLAIQAAKERADADSAYAKAVFNLNQALANSPQTVNGVNQALGQFGLSLAGLSDPGGNGLLDQLAAAASAAADALNDMTVAAGGKPAKGGGGGSSSSTATSVHPVLAFAAGGKVPGPRSVNRDSVPAFLTPGEYVIDRRLGDKLDAAADIVHELGRIGAGGGLGGGTYFTGNFQVLGATEHQVGRALARIVTPAQNRQVGFRNY
jgi:cell wall-associated NlpC family hydrolase